MSSYQHVAVKSVRTGVLNPGLTRQDLHLLSCHPLVASYKLTDFQDPMLNSNYVATAIISKGANDTFHNPSCSQVVFKLKGYNETPTNQLQLILISILQVYIKILVWNYHFRWLQELWKLERIVSCGFSGVVYKSYLPLQDIFSHQNWESSLILDKHGAQNQFLHVVLRPLHEHSLTRIQTKTKIPNRPQAQKQFPCFWNWVGKAPPAVLGASLLKSGCRKACGE